MTLYPDFLCNRAHERFHRNQWSSAEPKIVHQETPPMAFPMAEAASSRHSVAALSRQQYKSVLVTFYKLDTDRMQ
jgi:hypothetical protein